MGYIAAIISKIGEDIAPTLIRMLEAASFHRGDAYGLASGEGVIVKRSPQELWGVETEAGLGHKLIKIAPNDPPQPLMQSGYTLALEGRVWHNHHPSSIAFITDLVVSDPHEGLRRTIKEIEGSYALASIEDERILCCRDVVGVVPLYYGENEKLAGLASNRKMLWTAGLGAKPVPPGHITEMTKRGVYLEPVRELCQPPVNMTSMDEAVETLDRLQIDAVEARCRGLFRVALGFSGGIDSSLLAHYLDRAGIDVDPICVGLEGSGDFGAAEMAAEVLSLPLRLKSFTVEDVDADLDRVLWSVEEPDPMKVGVAIPLYWAAKSAKESGHRIFFSGNGSDELFAGYQKYVREYAESGDAVRESLFRDVVASHEVNYERDYKTCADLGLELRLPFSDIRVIKYGLSLPLNLKLSKDTKTPRKLILRTLAVRLGFPRKISYVPKRAVQYSTGVNKALRLLARRSGKTLSGYLNERFKKVKDERLMDLC